MASLPQNTPSAPPSGNAIANFNNALVGSQVIVTPVQPAPQASTPQAPAQPIAQPSATVSPTPSGLDPQIVNLAKAIRQTESQGNFQAVGKSGEYGAYQFMPDTWAATAPKFGVNVPLNQATPEQQNQVAYEQLAEWKTQHPEWNVGNFASAWNAGPGKPDAYLQGNAGTNDKGVKYDTPKYANDVANAYQTFKAQTPATTDTTAPPTPEATPSLGGFAQNVAQSGLQLLGNVGEAVLHPIQTIQNIGGAAVGGVEKAAGETTDNTAKFDNVVNFFKSRYGSLDQFEKTLYHDPVGVAADLSTVLGVGGGALGLAGKAADVAKLGEAGSALGKAGELASTASDLTNPLSPIAAGIGKLAGPAIDATAGAVGKLAGFEPKTIEAIRENPSAFTPSEIASITRETVSDEVKKAFAENLYVRKESLAEYKPIRAQNEEFSVEHDGIDNAFRDAAKVDIKDGKIEANSTSRIRSPQEISRLQSVYNIYKPDFLGGKMTAEKFLNLRQDLDKIAYNENGIRDAKVAEVSNDIARSLNDKYRANIKGLTELDAKFSKNEQEIAAVRKGLFDKKGNPTDGLINLVANAGNPGNIERLARLEKLLPGITEKLKVLKAIEDIQKSMGNKVGTYGRSIAEAGGIVGGAATGHLAVAATAFAAMIISEPANAVKIIRAAENVDPKIVPIVLGRLSRYATISGETNRTTQEAPTDGTEPTSPPTDQGTPQNIQPDPVANHASLSALAASHNFDLSSAQAAGHSDQEIQTYLEGLTS